MGGVTISLGRPHMVSERAGFEAEVEAGTNMGAYNAARRGRMHAAEIYAGSGYRWPLEFGIEGGGGIWDLYCRGEWAEAAEFGIPAHGEDTEKWSMYNPEDGFPRDPRWRVRHVNHPGTRDLHMIEFAGELVAEEFEDILVAALP